MIDFDKDEHLIFEVRKHWLVFFAEVMVLIIFALLPLLVASFVTNINFNISFITGFSTSLFVFFYALWLNILWIIGLVLWTNYYLDVWIITSKKIIDVEQHGLFKREVSFLHLDKIQDITYEIKGLVPTMLNYGDLEVQTAGMQGSFPIAGVPNPEYVQSKLNEALVIHKTNFHSE
jgi:uncharacterized membrane protein YdbT with pleckstrin-like domain